MEDEYRLTLTFLIKRDLDPDIYASKVALACALHGAISEGEGIEAQTIEVRWKGYDKVVPIKLQGRILKMPRMWQSHRQR